MGTKSRVRACGALAAVNAAVPPVVADAQDSAIDRIEAIERQIGALQKELQQLKRELGEAKQQLRQSRGEAQRARGELRLSRAADERARQDALKAQPPRHKQHKLHHGRSWRLLLPRPLLRDPRG